MYMANRKPEATNSRSPNVRSGHCPGASALNTLSPPIASTPARIIAMPANWPPLGRWCSQTKPSSAAKIGMAPLASTPAWATGARLMPPNEVTPNSAPAPALTTSALGKESPPSPCFSA